MRGMGTSLSVLTLAGTLLAGSAGAVEVRTKEAQEPGWDNDLELKALVGAQTFLGDAGLRTTPGAAYGVAAALDLFSMIDGEISYQGAWMGMDSRTGQDATILENGGQAILMVSPTLGSFEPYAFAGLHLTRLSVLNDSAATALFVQDATLLRLPVGLGVDWVPFGGQRGKREADLLIGARVKYDFSLAGNAFPGLERQSGNPIQATLMVGASF